MNPLYTKYKNLKIDGSWIGLELGTQTPYFCTPIGAEIIGWDNGIHYCFIKDFGDMVFCVNPETCCDYNVYPIARNFCDFLGLILATGNTNILQQIIWWDKKRFEDFVNSPEEQEWRVRPEVEGALSTIRKGTGIAPIDTPFEYVKAIQKDFDYSKIQYSDEYYEVTGIENPNGTNTSDKPLLEFEPVIIKVIKAYRKNDKD